MDAPIRDLNDLRMEIDRLKGLEQQQSLALGRRFNGPGAVFSTIFSVFSGSPTGESKSVFDQDIAGLVSRFVLPLFLNKTIFRNSNFIIKTIVGIVSQRASRFITEDGVMGIWHKMTTLFHKATSEPVPEHRSVPEFSETA